MRRVLVAVSGVVVLLLANTGGCGGGGSANSNGGPDGSTDGTTGEGGSGGGSGGVSGGSSGGSGGGSSGGGSSGGTSGSSSGGKSSGSSSGGGSGSSSGGGSGSSSGGGSGSSSGGTAGDSVLMHHKNLNRDGLYVESAFTKAAIGTLSQVSDFSATLPDPNDAVYAQPLFWDAQGSGTDMVLVATEANNVYALNAQTGAQVWVKNLGTPVPLSSMQCGNIDPFGVTGTPVIDYASRTIFVDALVGAGSGPQHQVFALSIDTGAVQTGWPVIVDQVATVGNQTFSDTATGERGALAIFNGTLYVPFGGLYGDCGTYYGWIIGIDIAKPTQVTPWATTFRGGGIWSPAGISSDGTNLYVATGNTFRPNNTDPWGGGDGVVSLTPGSSLAMAGFFAPTEWQQLDDSDLDMGPTPIVFDLAGSTPTHLAVTLGKDSDAYLLDRTNLGGVGSALGASGGNSYSLQPSNSQIISAPVLYTTPTATYVVFKGQGTQCTNSTNGTMTALTIVPGSPPTLAPSWCGGNGSGSPIVTTSDGTNDAIVWDLGSEGDNHLEAFDGDTGAAIPFTGSSVSISNMRRYNAPIAAKGKIYVPADGTLIAFGL